MLFENAEFVYRVLFENAEFVTCALMDENAFAAEANLVAALPLQLNLSNILKSQRPSIFPLSGHCMKYC